MSDSSLAQDSSAATWWAQRRWVYNRGLVIGGIVAVLCYGVLLETVAPHDSENEITAFHGLGYLIMIGVANLCYGLGPLSEKLFDPIDRETYRRMCFQLGFWFSVLLPFCVPVLFVASRLAFPNAYGR